MKVIIAGAGEVGWYIAERVTRDGNDVTIIDSDPDKVRLVETNLDVHVVYGSAASTEVLTRVGIQQADLFVAVTGHDETNLVCASVARKLGAARAMARVDEVVYRKAPKISYRQHFGIDELVSPEMLAALELASFVRNPSSLAVEHFARGELEMQQVKADAGARLLNIPLLELELPEGVRLASICRGENLIIPQGADHVEPDDLITIVGKTEQVVQARAGFEAEAPRTQKVVIMGGGHTTLSLARRLRSREFRITIIERCAERCKHLAAVLPNATILHGDGTNLAFLKEERIDNAHAFISTTANDEANIMSAIQAKNLGAKKVLVLIHRPDYADLMEKIGIDRAISPRAVMAREILAVLRKGKVSTLARLEGGQAEILELTVEGKNCVGKTLRQLELPGQTLVLTLQRGRDVILPRADTLFQHGDTVLVICRSELHKKVVRIIVGGL